MEYLHAIFLAIVQGITEFLPVSSSAHLILVPKLLGWKDQGLAFDVAVHVGTLLAVIMYLRKELLNIIPAWFGGWKTRCWDEYGRLGWWVIIATIPVGLFGLFGDDWIEANLRHPLVIAAATLVFGLLLGWADIKADQNQKSETSMSWKHALFVGFAQVLALIPGTSRSGVTMTAALASGYSRTAAARFSFMLGIPAIALPGLLKGFELLQSDIYVDWSLLFTAMTVAAVIAFLCMQVFMRFVQTVGMRPFVIYRVLLAIVIVLVYFN